MDSQTAKKIKSKNTKIELLFAKALWAKNMRYKKNDKTVYGKPDFVFKGKKIAIFCDSEFWHGYNYLEKGERFKSNIEFWEKKIFIVKGIANVLLPYCYPSLEKLAISIRYLV